MNTIIYKNIFDIFTKFTVFARKQARTSLVQGYVLGYDVREGEFKGDYGRTPGAPNASWRKPKCKCKPEDIEGFSEMKDEEFEKLWEHDSFKRMRATRSRQSRRSNSRFG